MAQPVIEERVDVNDGKYTVILRSDGTSTALRHGEEWPALAGQTQLDNLTTALARDLISARAMLEELVSAIIPLRVRGTHITDLDTKLRDAFNKAISLVE